MANYCKIITILFEKCCFFFAVLFEKCNFAGGKSFEKCRKRQGNRLSDFAIVRHNNDNNMLYRKIAGDIENHLKSGSDKILVVEGARQIGKSYIIREVGSRLFEYFVEINFIEDDEGNQVFKHVKTTDDFYLNLSMVSGGRLGAYDNTLILLDEIQHYPQFLTMLKFLRQDHRYHFIASGSLLGLALRSTTSIPVGSIIPKHMYQLDFEEFMIANGFGKEAVAAMRSKLRAEESLSVEMHSRVMDLFRRYLLIGGMPDAVNAYLATHNIVRVREIQDAIHRLYGEDASKYESDNGGKLLIRRIYDMIPSQMENKKKRVVAKDIRGKQGDRFVRYTAEFEYLVSSGIAIAVHAISNPRYPLRESLQKNLLKLYMNDVGMLTGQLYHNNLRPILNDERSVNMGAVYESVVAQELKAHGHELYYYDNRQKGEVDFLVDDYSQLSILPIEVKSGRDYAIHSALNNMVATSDYHVSQAVVLSNEREIRHEGKIVYLPIYACMFFDTTGSDEEQTIF